jgi:hypothetical protein
MPHLHLLPLRRALAVAALAGIAAAAPAAIAAPASKSKTADLVVRDLEVEFAGETLEIFADVANVGKARAERRTDAVVAISADETLGEDDDILDATRVRRLRQHSSFELVTEIDVPADEDLPDGDVFLLVCADGEDELRERNEGNNCAAELIASADDATAEDDEDVESAEESEDEGEDFPVSEER